MSFIFPNVYELMMLLSLQALMGHVLCSCNCEQKVSDVALKQNHLRTTMIENEIETYLQNEYGYNL